jgi:hypothetical protein
MYKWIAIPFLIFLAWSCSKPKQAVITGSEIDKVVGQMTELMIHDVSNPPLAMRFYSYACVGAYAVYSSYDAKTPQILQKLTDFPSLPILDFSDSDPALASIFTMMDISSRMQPSGGMMKAWKQKYVDSLKNAGFDEQIIKQSQAIASSVVPVIISYAKADRYNKISNFPRYTPKKVEGTWYPTPPGYFAAVEPYFSTIRPYLIVDSALNSLEIQAPIAYSSAENSSFRQAANEVYLAGKSEEEKKIAAFWDCNPFALSENGHLLIGVKKISPGAHWMGIAGIACAQKKLAFGPSLLVRTVLSLGLMDAFWICWREKYHSNRIRPETAVRKLIDPTWKPFLQTPPFPEYPSGHSTVSTTAATVLTKLIGDNIAYTDTVEMRYGIASRSFRSFHQAAEEASISRFYGGIHFKDGITAGQEQGKKLGKYLLNKFNL